MVFHPQGRAFKNTYEIRLDYSGSIFTLLKAIDRRHIGISLVFPKEYRREFSQCILWYLRTPRWRNAHKREHSTTILHHRDAIDVLIAPVPATGMPD